MAITITNRDELIQALSVLGLQVSAEQGVFDGLFEGGDVADKPQIASLATVGTADATDEASAITLVNALKSRLNQVITALKA